jgi:hypothetical protein
MLLQETLVNHRRYASLASILRLLTSSLDRRLLPRGPSVVSMYFAMAFVSDEATG